MSSQRKMVTGRHFRKNPSTATLAVTASYVQTPSSTNETRQDGAPDLYRMVLIVIVSGRGVPIERKLDFRRIDLSFSWSALWCPTNGSKKASKQSVEFRTRILWLPEMDHCGIRSIKAPRVYYRGGSLA